MKLPSYLINVTPQSRKIALLLIIALPIAGFFFGKYYQAKTTYQQAMPVELVTSGSATPSKHRASILETITNTRVGYSVQVPSNWIVLADTAYSESVQAVIDRMAPISKDNGTSIEVSRYVISTSEGYADCQDNSINIEKCIESQRESGATLAILVQYRQDKNIDETISTQKKMFPDTSFVPAESIAGQKTYEWVLGNICQYCDYKHVIFYGKDNFQFFIERIVRVLPDDLNKNSATETFYKSQLDYILKSLTLTK